MGFNKWLHVSGQTYTRKLDHTVLSALSGVDLRIEIIVPMSVLHF